MYWMINERCYKTLEEAIIASEECRKNMEIFSFNNIIPTSHFEDVTMASNTIEEVSAYDTLGNKIATWAAYKSTAAKDNKNIINCRNCGAPVRSCICEYCGTVY